MNIFILVYSPISLKWTEQAQTSEYAFANKPKVISLYQNFLPWILMDGGRTAVKPTRHNAAKQMWKNYISSDLLLQFKIPLGVLDQI